MEHDYEGYDHVEGFTGYDFKPFVFGYGDHDTREQGMCLMECVAYLAGEPHSDHPRCASPVLTILGIELNDSYPGEPEEDAARQLALADLPWRLIGTKADEATEFVRLRRLAEWLQPRVKQLLRAISPQDYKARIYLGRIITRLIMTGDDMRVPAEKAAVCLTNSEVSTLKMLGHQALSALGSLSVVDHLESRATFLTLLWWHYKNLRSEQSLAALRQEQQALKELLVELIQLTEPQERVTQPAVGCALKSGY